MSIVSGFGSGADSKLNVNSGNSVRNGIISSELMCSDRYNIPTITYDGSVYIFTLPYNITQYEIGKVVNIQGIAHNGISMFENPYIKLGQLEAVQISGTIRNGKFYNLIYDGSMFVVNTTTIGVSNSPLIFTSSGTYSIDPELRYNAIVIGGGGGSAMNYDSYYGEYHYVASGGGGGKVEDVFEPDSDTVTITVGAAGANRIFHDNSSADNWGTGTATSGGDSQIGSLIAYGGNGGGTSGSSSTNGSNGGYSGGIGYEGVREGWTINNVTYGAGGLYYSNGNSGCYSVTRTPSAGVVILTPII